MALYTLVAKGTPCKAEHAEEGSSNPEMGPQISVEYQKSKGKNVISDSSSGILESDMGRLRVKDQLEGESTSGNNLVEAPNSVMDSRSGLLEPNKQLQQPAACTQSTLEGRSQCNSERTSSRNSFQYTAEMRSNCSYLEVPTGVRANLLGNDGVAMEGPSEEGSCYQLNNNSWLTEEQRPCSAVNSSCEGIMSNEWGRCGMPPLAWGGRIVGRRDLKTCAKGICGLSGEDYDAFVNIFEGGSLLYSNMTFEALLNVRKQLEELGFPGKAVNDSLWLQV